MMWGLLIFGSAILTIYAAVSLVNPENLILTDQPRSYRMQLTPEQGQSLAEIDTTEDWIKKPELRVSATVNFYAGNRWLVLYFFLGIAVLLTAGLLSLKYLKRFFDSFSAGSPFDPENPKRLRLIGWLTIGQALFETLYNSVMAILVSNGITIKGIAVNLEWEHVVGEILGVRGYQVFMGFIILVIAEAFKIGSQLREEQELTV